MKYKLLKLKKPYNLIVKIILYSIIFISGIIFGLSISNFKNHNEISQIDSSIIDEYTCATGNVHKFYFDTKNYIRKSNGSQVEVRVYICRKCGYYKKIVVE